MRLALILYHLAAALLGRLAFATLYWPSRLVPWSWRLRKCLDFAATLVGFWALDHEAAIYELRRGG